jgi:hypothetical protein
MPPGNPGGGPNPGYRLDYDPVTKQVTLTFNAAVVYVFDYEGNIISKKP